MHAYGTNSTERTAAIVKLFPVAAIGAILGLLLLEELEQVPGFSAPLWVQALVGGPSASGALIAAYTWVDRTGWRKRWIRSLLGISLPDLNGRWRVVGQTSFVDPLAGAGGGQGAALRSIAAGLGKRHRRRPSPTAMSRWEAEATIAQTWSELSVFLETEFSSSASRSGSILINHDGGLPTLTYEYVNTPKPGARQTMQLHRGLVRLVVKEDKEIPVLDGEYYTHPRDRGNFGTMRLERLSPD